MGLSEPKIKQRISQDPRNTNWSNDTSRFGFKMLEKMGWKPGKGLGIKEDGNLEHIKTSFNTDNRGIGASAKTGELWLENATGFSQILARLNSNLPTVESTDSESSTPEKKPKSKKEGKKEKKSKKDKEGSEKDKKEKKSKKNKSESEEDKKEKKSKKNKEVSEKKKKSKRSKEVESEEETTHSTKKSKKESSKDDSDQATSKEPTPAPIRLSHRARYIQNKRLSTMDPSSLSAIFGVRS